MYRKCHKAMLVAVVVVGVAVGVAVYYSIHSTAVSTVQQTFKTNFQSMADSFGDFILDRKLSVRSVADGVAVTGGIPSVVQFAQVIVYSVVCNTAEIAALESALSSLRVKSG